MPTDDRSDRPKSNVTNAPPPPPRVGGRAIYGLPPSPVAPQEWWSISQVVVWIVSRDLALVERTPIMDYLDHLPYVAVNQRTAGPPVAKSEASQEILRMWRAASLDLFGRADGQGEQAVVPQNRITPLSTYGFSVVNSSLSVWVRGLGRTEHWSHLWLKSAQCMACWPAPADNQGPVAPQVEAFDSRRQNVTLAPTPVPTAADGPSPPSVDEVAERFGAWAKSENEDGRPVTEGAAMKALGDILGVEEAGRNETRRMLEKVPREWRAQRGESLKHNRRE